MQLVLKEVSATLATDIRNLLAAVYAVATTGLRAFVPDQPASAEAGK